MIPPPTRVIYKILGQEYPGQREFRSKDESIAKGTSNVHINVT